MINFFIDQLKRTETDHGYINPYELLGRLATELAEYSGSYAEGFIIADHMESIGKAFKEKYIEEAFVEVTVANGDEQAEFMGVTINPVEAYFKYEYPEDALIDQYKEQETTIKKEIKPFNDQLKTIQKSIKVRQEQLVNDGNAKLTSSTKTLKLKRTNK